MEKVLIILRGLPGSGKSTFAKILSPYNYICTADDYHMIDGKYDWKPENVAKAHKACQDKCEVLMKLGATKVVVANTSTTEKELTPYYNLAQKYNYQVFSVILENRHNGTNSHNVPDSTLNDMRNRFDVKL